MVEELECHCGKTVTGKTPRQAKANLENHKVTHGEASRFEMGGKEENNTKIIRETAEEIIKDKGRASSNLIRKGVRKKILARDVVSTTGLRKITNQWISRALTTDDKFRKVSRNRGDGRGITWGLH